MPAARAGGGGDSRPNDAMALQTGASRQPQSRNRGVVGYVRPQPQLETAVLPGGRVTGKHLAISAQGYGDRSLVFRAAAGEPGFLLIARLPNNRGGLLRCRRPEESGRMAGGYG